MPSISLWMSVSYLNMGKSVVKSDKECLHNLSHAKEF